MKVIKERSEIKNPNYRRFYEFNSRKSDICNKCDAFQKLDGWVNINPIIPQIPVHTNWKKGDSHILTVYICESPSNRELSHRIPSLGMTGQNIYRQEISNTLKKGWLDELDNQIYRTNIVRCQADSGLQKRVDTTIKNRRVRQAFNQCKQHLKVEVENILKTVDNKSDVRFIIAIGGSFPNQLKEIEKMFKELSQSFEKFSWQVVNHPSSKK